MRGRVPALRYVAPDAAHIAAAEADEVSRLAAVQPFPLERVKVLHYGILLQSGNRTVVRQLR